MLQWSYPDFDVSAKGKNYVYKLVTEKSVKMSQKSFARSRFCVTLTLMLHMRKIAQFGLLATLMFAVNVFVLAKCLHERHPMVDHHSHHSLPHSQQRGTSRSRISATDQACAGNHLERSVAPKLKPIVELSAHLALPSRALELFVPQFVAAPLAEQPVLSLGSAARAPGAPRGPPSLS